jgi:integrase
LKEEFSGMQLRQIKPMQVERLKSSLLGKKTVRGTVRSGATVNRYVYLLSAILRTAHKHGFVSSNPCTGVDKEKEAGNREQYLRGEQEGRLLNALEGDLAFLRPAIILALGTGLRRMEMMRLRVHHINFGNVSVFHRVNGKDEECPPNHFLVEKTKNGKPRMIPMNESVRSTLYDLVDGAAGDDFVFSFAKNGVSCRVLSG